MKLAITIAALITAIAALIKSAVTQRDLEQHIAQLELDVEMLIQNNRLNN